jgi:zinc transport system substrate-binding protein
MMERRVAGAFVVMAALVLASVPGCSRATRHWDTRGGPPRIVVTIPALDNFVRQVGGNHVAIVCLCTTEGPHQYEDKPEDAILMRDADLFFAIGLTLDDKFADRIQLHSHNPHLQYVKLGERLRDKDKSLLRRFEEEHEHGKEEEHEHGHEHEHGEYDPHVWLGIKQAIALVEIIRDELQKVDPNHKDDYEANAKKFLASLKKLEAYGKDKLKDKKNRKLIAFHESLGYFAESFELKIVDVLEEIPGSEASSGHITQLADKCKKEDVRVIAVEPQYSKESSAEVLRKNLKDITVIVVDPLETVEDKKDLEEDGKELQSKDWYVDKMRKNLDALAKSLP